jgi:class 3 adenylate cyclase/tetratricopeptide (TPR) repeat protein
MPCPRCGAQTSPGQKFCAECGLSLSRACPNCGTPYEDSPKFCAECGTSLSEGVDQQPRPNAGSSLAGGPAAERRYVTVLFADLVAFTALAEDQDPEAVRELLSHYFETARQVIEGYGGTVEKFIGDAVMAVWGAPVAREDDAERAVRAALELVHRVSGIKVAGQPLALRAGVLSGEAAVVPGRTGEGMVAGDLVNTASRLQSVAAANVVLVGESTYSATRAAIAYEPAGEQVLKGKEAPVPSWRALRVVARIGGEGREEGLEPPFVGRDEELRLLKDQLHAAERESKLRMVAISGQAGIGKSRLVWELEKYLDGLAGPRLYYWHQGRSPSYGEGITYWALGEMVRRRARIAEDDDETTTREKLGVALAQFVPDPAERRWLEPALGALLGIDEADWAAREQLFSAWRTFLERIADQGPTVLAFEDLQWADSGMLDFIEHLLEWARDHPILIVTLARPELLERRPNFGMGHRALVALHLEPLEPQEIATMIRGLVPEIDEPDLERIVERSEGVPLFAVETIRALLDAGHLIRHNDVYELSGPLPSLEVPPTLRALIASRLDALEAADRALLQDAAVIGQVFSMPALAALSERPVDEIESRLRALAQKELVQLEADPRSPERGRFRFKQSLIRETSYSTLGRRERRARHLAAAHYYETLDDDELAGVKAAHYVEAFRAAPEGEDGSAVAAQARVALRAAADRAERLHSPDQALSYLEQAMAVTFDESDLNDLRVRAAGAAYASAKLAVAEEHLQQAIDWHIDHGERGEAAMLTAQMADSLFEQSQIDEAMRRLHEALAALPPGNERAVVALDSELARGHLFRDEGAQALTAVSQALETAARERITEPTLQLLITKSWALSNVGQYREAVALLIGAMHMADREGQLLARIRSRFNLSSFLIIDDPHESLRIAREGIEISRQFGMSGALANMIGNAAHAAQLVGDLDGVLQLVSDMPEIRTSLGLFAHGHAAVAAALRDDFDGAAERMLAVEESTSESSSAQDLAALRYVQGWLALARGDLAAAQRLSFEGGEAYVANASLSGPVASHAALLLGDLEASRRADQLTRTGWAPGAWLEGSLRNSEAGILALEGRVDEARRLYRRVIEQWRQMELPMDLALTLVERARLLGHVDADAAAGRDEAAEIFAAMGASGFLERVEAVAGPTVPPPSVVPVVATTADAAAAQG